MEPFEIVHADGRKTTGLLCLPPPVRSYSSGRPLVVAVHGGTYSAKYYDLDAEHSIANIATALNVPVVCISRPGYGDSTALGEPEEGESPIRQHGRYLHEIVLPAIWEEYGQGKTGTSSIVLQGHSIGAAVSIVAAGLYGKDARPKYVLSGLITSGMGCILHPDHKTLALEYKAKGVPSVSDAGVVFPDEAKNHLMINEDMALTSPAVYAAHHSLNESMPAAEHYDVLLSWYEYWSAYAEYVNVPHFATFPQHDRMCLPTEEHLAQFKAGFRNCPVMDTSFLPGAPHCIELSYIGQAWLTRAFGFAMQCPIAKSLAWGSAD